MIQFNDERTGLQRKGINCLCKYVLTVGTITLHYTWHNSWNAIPYHNFFLMMNLFCWVLKNVLSFNKERLSFYIWVIYGKKSSKIFKVAISFGQTFGRPILKSPCLSEGVIRNNKLCLSWNRVTQTRAGLEWSFQNRSAKIY